jgi:hypothetical protein
LVVTKIDGFKGNLVIIFGDAQLSGNEAFLREFAHLCHKSKFPSVYGWDFNLVQNASEKSTSGGLSKWNTIFNIIIENNNLLIQKCVIGNKLGVIIMLTLLSLH